MPCYSPLKGFRSVSTGGIVFKRSSDAYEAMEVACGSCLGCRLDRSRTWAVRIIHESSLWPIGYSTFVTLTYDDEKLPEDMSIHVRELQLFFKKLRKKVRPGKVRYFAVGEYGAVCPAHGKAVNSEAAGIERCLVCKVGRPHYHVCLFGVQFNDAELYSEREGIRLFTSEALTETWGNGYATFGELTYESAAYCARYCLKKITGEASKEHYLSCTFDGEIKEVTPEFVTMSRRPGIGHGWFEKYIEDVFPSDEVPVPGRGVLRKAPRYYEKQLEAKDPKMLEDIKELRKAFRKAHADEYTPERLWSKYKVKKAQLSQLKRNLE